MTLDELEAALASATGPSRELDRAFAKLIGWHRIEPRHTSNKKGGWITPGDWLGTMSDGSPILDSLHGTTIHRDPPAFTASTDAWLSAVPAPYTIHINVAPVTMHFQPEVKFWRHGDMEGKGDITAEAATLPLALGLAIVRAMMAEREG